MSSLILLTIAVVFAQTDAKFPMDPKPCGYGDKTCIKGILDFLLHEKAGGNAGLNLVEFDPLNIAAIDINQGKESPVNIDLKFRKVVLTGVRGSQITDVKGFGKDLMERHELRLTIPTLTFVAEYTVSGRVLILPVQGTGRSNVTLVNTDVGMFISGIPDVKPDGTYLKMKNLHLSLEPKRVLFNFENLFNGDKALSDNFNLFLNDNWKDIYGELRVSIENAFSKVFESVAGNVFQKFPYDKFFLE